MAKKWYAVQVGGDTDCGTGSHNKREAIKMAHEAHRRHRGQRVEICVCTDNSDFCLDLIHVYGDDGKRCHNG